MIQPIVIRPKIIEPAKEASQGTSQFTEEIERSQDLTATQEIKVKLKRGRKTTEEQKYINDSETKIKELRD